MDPLRFAQELAAIVAEVLPPGFRVRATGDGLSLDMPDGDWAFVSSAPTERSLSDPTEYADAAEILLSALQDHVCHSLAGGWPMLEGGRQLALPGARLDGSHLHLWFGEEQAPAVALRPIDLAM